MTDRLRPVVLALLASALVSFGATPVPRADPPKAGPATAVAAQKTPPKVAVAPIWKLKEIPLRKEMSAAEVRTLLGEPDQLKAGTSKEGQGEVWIYRRAVDIKTWEIPDGTRVESRLNRATGQFEVVEVPNYRDEFHQVFDTVVLLLIEQRLKEWRRTSQVAKEPMN
jgi:hypothetical protein